MAVYFNQLAGKLALVAVTTSLVANTFCLNVHNRDIRYLVPL